MKPLVDDSKCNREQKGMVDVKRGFFGLVTAVLSMFVLISCSQAAGMVETKDFEKYFTGITTGTFIMYDEAKDRYTVYNEPQSRVRLSPCSTFKIYNSMAGLETGVLDQKDVYTVFKWNGTKYPFTYWEHDQTLASATRDSVVWYFQELATRIGSERMQAFLDKIGYGNRDISGGLTTFWLGSSLKISAREQVDLLWKLYSGKLPVSMANVEIVKRNITLSEEHGVRFMGKTGSNMKNEKWIQGWFVGCVEKQEKRYFYATNVQGTDGANGAKAREITKFILKDLKVLP